MLFVHFKSNLFIHFLKKSNSDAFEIVSSKKYSSQKNKKRKQKIESTHLESGIYLFIAISWNKLPARIGVTSVLCLDTLQLNVIISSRIDSRRCNTVKRLENV